MWEKEKMLVTSIFSFSYILFQKPSFFFVVYSRDGGVKNQSNFYNH